MDPPPDVDTGAWRDRYAPPPARHFFSYRTRISLELPLDWEQEDTDHEGQERYVADRDADEIAVESTAPRLLVSVVPGPPDQPAAREIVANGIVAELGPAGPVRREMFEVDGFDATLWSFPAVQGETRLAVRVCTASADDRIVAIVASAAATDEAPFDAVVRSALTSIRVIR